MPNTTWSDLSPMQLGRYAEYYAKMEFASYAYDIYTSEVDDHGVDFVARAPGIACYYEVQVKSVRKTNYIFIPKDKMEIGPRRLVCLLHFQDGSLPAFYVIPSTAWLAPNKALVDRSYGKPGQKSKPEWGINFSKQNLPLLEPYRVEAFFKKRGNP